ncbi:MAG: hypothetical protein ACI4IQ_07055 [Eubacterium sp.]
MWISRQMPRSEGDDVIQTGKVTLNNDGEVEAVSTGVERNLEIYAPFGYSYSMPSGCEVLLTQSNGEKTALGVIMNGEGLECGEIKISAESGAYVLLKNNGSVIINGLEISSDGVIK